MLDDRSKIVNNTKAEDKKQSNISISISLTKNEEIERKSLLGSGGYGSVWLCKWRTIDVAVKYLDVIIEKNI